MGDEKRMRVKQILRNFVLGDGRNQRKEGRDIEGKDLVGMFGTFIEREAGGKLLRIRLDNGEELLFFPEELVGILDTSFYQQTVVLQAP